MDNQMKKDVQIDSLPLIHQHSLDDFEVLSMLQRKLILAI
jgi:hypothetical protein